MALEHQKERRRETVEQVVLTESPLAQAEDGRATRTQPTASNSDAANRGPLVIEPEKPHASAGDEFGHGDRI